MDMNIAPDGLKSTQELFGIQTNWQVPFFSAPSEHVPDIDPTYVFDEQTTRILLAGFMYNRRVLVQGYHGTGKSTHIEQIAARLNWPCIRINLDSHVSRLDLIGRDIIRLEDGKQITEFKEGLLPYALRRPVALVFDEYDAARPDVMFVLQRVLESQGKLTLLDQNTVITPNHYFRLFATTNTIGLGDSTGIYHGTQPINQGQMDRWHMVTTLNYLPEEIEMRIVSGKVDMDKNLLASMIAMANLTRTAFINGDLSTVMSPRTVISWAENTTILEGDVDSAFTCSFFNKSDENDRPVLSEMYQRCFNRELAQIAA